MATIEELNFKLIIDDAKFTAMVQKDLQMANQLNITLSQLLNLKKQSSGVNVGNVGNLSQITQAYRELAKAAKDAAQSVKSIGTARITINNKTTDATASLTAQSRILRDLTGYAATYLSIFGAEKLVRNMVRVSAEFELQRTSLRAILNDTNGADAIFSRIKDLAVLSPFSFKELVSYVKQLSAYSIPMEELYDTTKMLADVSAGLGVGMDRLVLAYGQIRSASFLRGQEVRQLTEAGVPILTELAKQFEELEGRAVSAGEVFDKISSRLVTFEMVEKVFKDMTSEGGKFYNMQEIQAETLQGKLSNLRDAYEIMFAEIGEGGVNDFLKDSVDAIRSLFENYERIGKQIAVFATTLGVARTALLAMDLATNKVAFSTTLLGKAMTAISKNPYMLIAAGVAAIATALYSATTQITEFQKMMQTIDEAVDSFSGSVSSEVDLLDHLFGKLRKAKQGTDEYNSALKAINSEYSEYITNIDTELLRLGKVNDAYNNIKKSMTESFREKYFQEASSDIKSSYTSQYSDLSKQIEKLLKDVQGKGLKAELASYMRGEIMANEMTSQAYEYLRDNFKKTRLQRGADKSIFQEVNEAEELRKEFISLGDSYSVAMDSLTDRMGWMFTETKKKAEAELSDIAKIVQSTLAKFGITEQGRAFGIWADGMTDRFDYVDNLKKVYDELGEKIEKSQGAFEKDIPELQKRREIIEAIADALGNMGLLADKSTKSSSSSKSQEEKDLEERIKQLKALKSAYDDLKEYVSDEDMGGILSAIFSHIDKGIVERLDFDDQLLEVAKKLQKLNTDTAKATAESLNEFLGGDKVGELKDKLRTLSEWKDFMGSLFDTGELEGEGVTFNISKVVKAYEDGLNNIAKKRNEITKKYTEAAKATSGTSGLASSWKTISGEYLMAMSKTTQEEKNLLTKAQNDLFKEAEKFAKEYLESSGFELSNFSDKTINELLRLKDTIRDFDAENVPDSIKDALSKANVSLDDFIAKIREAFGKWDETTDESLSDKRLSQLIRAAQDIQKLTKSIADLAEASDNQGLYTIASALGGIAEVVENVAQGFKSGGYVGAAIAGITTLGGLFLNAAQEAEQLRRAIYDARIEAEKFYALQKLNTDDSFFGDNAVSNIRNAVDILRKYREETRNDLENHANDTVSWKSGIFHWESNMRPLEMMLNNLGYELTDQYGNLNKEGLQAILDTYKNLTKTSRQWIQEAIKNSELYEEALNSLHEEIEGVFGSLADSMADGMINSYLEIGDATRDLADYMGDTFDDLAKSIAKSLISSFIIDNVLNGYKDDVTNLYKEMTEGYSSPETISSMFASIAKNIEKDAESAALFTNKLMDALATSGITFDSSNSQSSLGSGIKTITEESASLLASYINAIRADVSASRLTLDGIGTDVKAIVSLISSPTLNDYLMKIQANTFNTAENTNRILDRLDSVMTSEMGASAFRVAM